IGNGRLSVSTVINVLGTYSASCTYYLSSDFTFQRESLYSLARSDGYPVRSVTLKRDGLPATTGDGQSVALSKGTELTLTATDEESFADVTDGAGNAYSIRISRTEDDWEWYIGGIAESEWFEELMYAG
ncbi:MAG: hypothetical protein Q4C13_08340, partial [Clostridia bacterium]|nr:hypothetical protein [Clostridia bacterium]